MTISPSSVRDYMYEPEYSLILKQISIQIIYTINMHFTIRSFSEKPGYTPFDQKVELYPVSTLTLCTTQKNRLNFIMNSSKL